MIHMYISKAHWRQVKKQLPILIFVILIQTWLIFNFPAFVFLGSPFDGALKLLTSIGCAFVYMYIIIYPEKLAPLATLDFLDSFPNRKKWKRVFKILMVAMIFATFWYLKHVNYYHMQSMWYGILYLSLLIPSILLYSVVGRSVGR